MIRKFENFGDHKARLFPELHRANGALTRTVTFQVTDACNLNCSYCYQINKGTRKMSIETAKKFIDYLLNADESNEYINPVISPFLIIEFIGGEPFLEIKLIDEIMDYFIDQAFKLQHPWATRYCISICSNGTLYFEPEVQRFFNKHRNHISFSVTIDGNKELHDSCRVFYDGSPSYDLAWAAAQDWISKGGYMGSKITICPENLPMLNDALRHFVSLGYEEINANCVYEEGWTIEDASELYNQMKNFADYMLDNKLNIFCSLYEENFFHPKEENDLDNWCWGKGTPILTTNGYKPIEEIKVGDLVYTEDGSIHPVINTTSRTADNVVRISVSGIFDLVCTNNHKIFAKPFNYKGWNNKKYYNQYDKYQIKDLKHKDLIKIFQLPEGKIEFNKDLAYIVGRYIGDGWNSTTGYKICCAHKEEKELKEKFDKANIEYSISNHPTVKQFNIFKSNKELIKVLSTCGEKAINKHLPSECFNWTKDSLKSLLQGYMDADGTINVKEQFRFNTISYQLAQELMIILRTLGFTPTCYHNKRGGKSKILNREVNIHDRYEVYYYKNPKRAKYVHEEEDGMWTYGLKITSEEPQTVYNLTVDTNHSYIAGGLASANCGGNGKMLACDPDGYLYPCIRYMESSLGADQPPIRIGHVDHGLEYSKEEKDWVKCLNCIDRRTQSTDECFYCPIAEGCSWCFPAGTKVSTPAGLVDIESISVGDIVLDMNGEERSVEATTNHIAADLVYVKAAGLPDLLTTYEHPFWCKPVVKRYHNIPVYGEPQWVKAKDLKVSDKIGLFVPKLGNEHIDSEIAYLLGRYIGDGWKTPSNREKHPYKYYICCAFDEQDELEKHLNNANISHKKSINKTVAEYYINISGTNNEFLTNLFDKCGRYATDKKVPREVWNWDRESVEFMLKGYFDADGCVDKKRNIQRFTSVSKELVLNISELIRGVYHKNVNITHRKVKSSGNIEGRTINQHDSYEGRYNIGDVSKKYNNYDEENNIMWVNVRKSNKDIPKSEQVYNISVSESPTFIANGALVHNCSAYNYQVFGTPDKRATYICEMHKARSLANVYYWNKRYAIEGIDKQMKMYCPKEWAIPIIGEEEYNYLLEVISFSYI